MSKGLGTFVAGVALGAAIGVLYAPKKGSETREDLKELLEDNWKNQRYWFTRCKRCYFIKNSRY